MNDPMLFRARWCWYWCFAILALGRLVVWESPVCAATRAEVASAVSEGNWSDALTMARERLDEGEGNPRDLRDAVDCLLRLGRVDEADRLLESVESGYADDSTMLRSIAESYMRLPNRGRLVAGEFRRGEQRDSGPVYNCAAADRSRAVRVALAAVRASQEGGVRSEACRVLADALSNDRRQQHAWRLQKLTDLENLPEPAEGWREQVPWSPPPATEAGTPVLYETPDSWESARNDGERWRWALAERAESAPNRRAEFELAYAQFLYEQFGVQTALGDPAIARLGEDPRAALRSLDDSETVAKLATGVQRFTLPEGHRFLEMFARHKQWRQIAEIRVNRQQRSLAAEAYRSALAAEQNPRERDRLQTQIDQLLDPWVRLDAIESQPAQGSVAFRASHRNAEKVQFTAKKIDHRRLIADTIELLKGPSMNIDHRDIEIENLGWRVLQENGDRYLQEVVATWTVETTPGEDHSDTSESFTAPLPNPGAYLITATPEGGVSSHAVAWVADTVLVEKPAEQGPMVAVLDARTGSPVAGATVELFGHAYESPNPKPNRVTKRYSELTDDDGIAPFEISAGDQRQGYNWITTASKEGRFAFLGFSAFWSTPREDSPNLGARVYLVTDRPVYRPGDTMKFKAWVAKPDYSVAPEGDGSEFAHKAFEVELFDARGESIWKRPVTANAYGGLVGEIEIDQAATLGRYRLSVVGFGDGAFRVEEYRKPEFEVVIDAPEKPVRLGDSFEATVRANYYFGSPVTEGSVNYKVTRTRRSEYWFPVGPWDWLYGKGYGWLAPEATWHSSWRSWRCYCPPPWWWPQPQAPPEVVAEGVAELDAEGTLRVPVDTRGALERWPDDDHNYAITAEVTDASRRVITGSGSVLAARRPASVTVVLDRGHYNVGDTVRVTTHLRTPGGNPVAGPGELRLMKIDAAVEAAARESEDKPPKTHETQVQAWDLATGPEGRAELRLKASEPGRYRVVYATKAIQGERIEGGVVFTILGPGFDGSDFRFSALELTPDKSEYKPGDTVRLLVCTDRRDAVVALYTRPANGVYEAPRVIRLEGKRRLIELPVIAADQPNFFVEAVTVADGRLHNVVKQIAVPPAPRMIQVEAAPSSHVFLPGQEGKIRVRLTDAQGEPLVGEATVAVYDKSVEAIAPDVLPGDIRERFWGWRRNHYPRTRHSLSLVGYPQTAPGEEGMQHLGGFSQYLDDLSRLYFDTNVDLVTSTMTRSGPMSGRMMLGAELSLARAPAPMAAMEGAEMAMADSSTSGADKDAADAVTVRTNFADTALWVGSVVTDTEGFAELPIHMPEGLTAWSVRVWALGDGVRVGHGKAEVVTRKDLMVRLQTPRFLVETDEAVLSAVVHNYLDSEQTVRVRLTVEGEGIETPTTPELSVRVGAGGESLVDWRVAAQREGTPRVTATAVASSREGESAAAASDAMRLELPVLVHGAERVESFNDVISPQGRLATFELMVPEARRPDATRLSVSYATTLVGAMLAPLPYLAEYPHGCTEQTLNRFLPSVIVHKTLQDLGVDFDQIPAGGPAQQAIRDTPVGDADTLRSMVLAGVRRLDEMQLSDGGWGWFSGLRERSTPHTTAVVVRGLILAKSCEVAVPAGVIERGLDWLESHRDEQLSRLANVDDDGEVIDRDRPWKHSADNTDALVALVLAEGGRFNAAMRDRLFKDRLSLSPYCLATLGLALHLEMEASEPQAEELASLRDRAIRNLQQFLVEDPENQTAYLDLPGGAWWYWYGSEFEAHAYYLKLLSATDPKGELAPKLVKYLVNNRRNATHWNSTRDTALVVEALAEYASASGETTPPGDQGDPTEIEVWVDGQRRDTSRVSPSEAILFEGNFELLGEELAAGRHTLELRKKGPGRLYVTGALANFSLEEQLRAAGIEVRVERRVSRLVPIDDTGEEVDHRGGVVDIATKNYRRIELPNLASVKSGDLIEVELLLTSKNDYEYVLVEDPKPAGFEALDTRSGYNGNPLGAYVEFRDQRVCFYASRLPRGEHSVRYRLRAETPGSFAALPTQVSAMYAPELRGNSDEIRLKIEDKR